ncbi:MAG: IS3 family transposase, partial [Anaerolineales bacterium]
MLLAVDFSVQIVCEMLGLARSSYYYRSQKADDGELRAAVSEEAAAWPAYGYRRITNELRRKGWMVNEKKVRRLMREMNLQVKQKGPKRRTTDSRHDLPRYPNLIKQLEIIRPDQVWASDITYIRLRREFVYLAVIMDVCSRAIRGWNLSRTLDHSL